MMKLILYHLYSLVSCEGYSRVRFNVEVCGVFLMVRVQTINIIEHALVSVEEVRSSSECRRSLTSLTVQQTLQTKTTFTHVPLVFTFSLLGAVTNLGIDLSIFSQQSDSHILTVAEIVLHGEVEVVKRSFKVSGVDATDAPVPGVGDNHTPAQIRGEQPEILLLCQQRVKLLTISPMNL